MSKYKIVALVAASFALNSVSVFADDLDAQPDQTYSSPAPVMEETPPGGDGQDATVVQPVEEEKEKAPATDGQE